MYKVYTHTTPDGDVYVGVTCQDLKLRWRPSQYKGKSLYPYIEQYGWKNIKHEVIYTCEDREEAYQVEGEMIDHYGEKGCCINKQRSGLIKSKDEKAYQRKYQKDHKEKCNELCRQWREANPDYQRKWQQYHREERAAYMRQWREANKEEWNAYQRQWRAKKKAEKLLQSGQIEMPIAV